MNTIIKSTINRILESPHVLIFLVVISIYTQVVQFEFSNLDTNKYLDYFDELKNKKNLLDVFFLLLTDTVNASWHPVTMFSLYIDYSIGGRNPTVFHVTNILLHLFNAYIVYNIFYFLFQNKNKALFIALIFAAHPLNVETAVWIGERKGILSAFFILLSILHYIFYLKTNTRKNFVYSIIFFIFSLLSKPTSISGLMAFIFIDIYTNRKQITIKNFVFFTINKWPYIVAAICLIPFMFFAQLEHNALQFISSVGLHYRFETIIHNFFNHISRFIIPVNLTVFYVYAIHSIYQTTFYLFAITALVVLTFKTKNKNKNIVFGFAWFIVFFLPVSGIIPSGVQTIADRYSYLPGIGLGIILVEFAVSFIQKNSLKTRLSTHLLSFFIIILALLSYLQTSTWRNETELWTRNYTINPRNFQTSGNLARILHKNGQTNKAIGLFYETIVTSKNTYFIEINFASFVNRLIKDKHYLEARFILLEGIRKNYRFHYLYSKLSYLEHFHFKNTKSAIYLLTQLINANPTNSYYYLRLANIYTDIGDTSKSKEILLDSLSKVNNPEVIKKELEKLSLNK